MFVLCISGEVPGLYSPEELEPLLSPLKDTASQEGFTGPLYNYFSYSQLIHQPESSLRLVSTAKSASFLPAHSISEGIFFKHFFDPVSICVGIQQNLHIVLIMDCSNSNFTINCESNPAFYRKCSVHWMEGWSESSMMKVSDGEKDEPLKETA